MELPLALIVIGIALYALLSPALGAAFILIGLVIAVWPRLTR